MVDQHLQVMIDRYAPDCAVRTRALRFRSTSHPCRRATKFREMTAMRRADDFSFWNIPIKKIEQINLRVLFLAVKRRGMILCNEKWRRSNFERSL